MRALLGAAGVTGLVVFASICAAGCGKTADVYVGSDLPSTLDAGAVIDRTGGNDPVPINSPDPVPEPPDAGHADAGLACAAGRADCDGDASNGCEVGLDSDPAHCGDCAVACETPDCACVNGIRVVVCATSFADCDGDASNGCEVDTTTSMQHCGGCDRRCHALGEDVMTATCAAGVCELECVFEPAFGNCDGDIDNGCEALLSFDPNNCGACGVQCACGNGECL